MRTETLTWTGVVAAAGLSFVACQPQSDPAVMKKLDEITTKLDALEKKVGAGGGRPMPQQPSGPDPSAVYAVPIEGSAYKGPEHAKVTIVEAFEFA